MEEVFSSPQIFQTDISLSPPQPPPSVTSASQSCECARSEVEGIFTHEPFRELSPSVVVESATAQDRPTTSPLTFPDSGVPPLTHDDSAPAQVEEELNISDDNSKKRLQEEMGGGRVSPSCRGKKQKRSPLVVIKIGSSSVLSDKTADGVNVSVVNELVTCVRDMREQMNARVVLVSSGAVAFGSHQLNLTKDQARKQALAAVGQSRVMTMWQTYFNRLGLGVAQVLMTRDSFGKKHHYENARATLVELLRLGVVPIVNENDVVAISELSIGDNDTMSALVASMLSADWLFLLTDVDALYTANPRTCPDAHPIHIVPDVNDIQADTSSMGSQWGTGGMGTKLAAARIACAAGVKMAITHSNTPQRLLNIMSGDHLGTVFMPAAHRLCREKRMIAHGLQVNGTLHLDAGAAEAVRHHNNLFAVGVRAVEGEFKAQDIVKLVDPCGNEVGRGECSLSASAMRALIGQPAPKHSAEQVMPRRLLCVAGLGRTFF